MKTLIIYASKTGTTEKCAGILGQNLKNSTIINLATIQNESIDKYDLIIIDKDNIEIWDWKTENVKLEYKNVKDRIQTIVYMLLAKEVVCKIFNLNISTNNIKMKYYQPQYDDMPIEIVYNQEKHEINKSNIVRYIDMIKNTNYEENDKYKYQLTRNDRHCKFCEFNKLCNRQDVDYSIFEEDVYEC